MSAPAAHAVSLGSQKRILSSTKTPRRARSGSREISLGNQLAGPRTFAWQELFLLESPGCEQAQPGCWNHRRTNLQTSAWRSQLHPALDARSGRHRRCCGRMLQPHQPVHARGRGVSSCCRPRWRLSLPGHVLAAGGRRLCPGHRRRCSVSARDGKPPQLRRLHSVRSESGGKRATRPVGQAGQCGGQCQCRHGCASAVRSGPGRQSSEAA